MSTIAEKARAEAERVEAEEPEPDDGGNGGEPEPEPEPEPAPEPEQAVDTEKVLKALNRESERHEKSLAKIMGADWEGFAACPVCQGFGYMPVGTQAPAELAFDETAEPCGRCRALGQLRTGSQVPGQETKPCPDCNGNGWKNKAAQVYVIPQQPQSPSAPAGYMLIPDPTYPPQRSSSQG